jgi:hypothetical protein
LPFPFKASEFEYRRATLLNRDLHDSKAFDQNNNYFSGQAQVRAAPDNAVQQLAETLASSRSLSSQVTQRIT